MYKMDRDIYAKLIAKVKLLQTEFAKSNLYPVEITIPSAVSSTSTANLPDGVTVADSIIEQVAVSKFEGANKYFMDTLSNDGVTFVYAENKITCITGESTPSAWLGETATVYIRRI